ncbi:FAD/NAD(P)-binding domain-containing protein [Zopfia rhizophila CBS 207.26]|uniref:FAD/NAD(P)-binding domain-containing protein n=1 Tax=Zopfia rhizophila CBS 207.26 TaxID=1314779 RepID=A0A6A6D7U0_9PEZI|nr:FAD/NAD(P)-binding domain-containing protein [Zopfia rhizophila CBS 207.26]
MSRLELSTGPLPAAPQTRMNSNDRPHLTIRTDGRLLPSAPCNSQQILSKKYFAVPYCSSIFNICKMTSSSESTITIIGAGPVGLYTAFLLAKAGISVHIFEKEAAVLQSPRAIVYHPVVVEDMKRSGIFQDVLDVGYVGRTGLQWRLPKSTESLASLPSNDKATSILLGQHDLADIFLQRLVEYKHVKVQFSTALESFEEGNDEVNCNLSTSQTTGDGQTKFEHRTKYLIGADGARSTVRKKASIPYEGFAWEDFRMVAANMDYDIPRYNGWGDASFICDPELWAVVVYCGKGNVWRVASAERLVAGKEEEWDEEAGIKRLYGRLGKLLNGPTDTAKVLAIKPYSLHQRCAATFVRGRIILAGDAAHHTDWNALPDTQITNPVGGLGLATGLLDASFLGRCLERIFTNKEPDAAAVLAEYNEKRRKVFLENTSPIATANRNRLIGATEEARKERAEYFAKINKLDMDFLKELVENQMAMASA